MSNNIPPVDLSSTAKKHYLWRTLLIASLMLNLLVVGLVIGRFTGHGPEGRQGGPAYAQFVPGRFLGDLARDRRHELAAGLRSSREDMQKLHSQSGDNAQKLAAELDSENYDAGRVGVLIDSFTTGPDSLAAGGGKVLKDFYAKLTPAERKLLAKAIREAPTHREGSNRGWRSRFWN